MTKSTKLSRLELKVIAAALDYADVVYSSAFCTPDDEYLEEHDEAVEKLLTATEKLRKYIEN